jgi:hypothetical protein
VRGFYEGHIRSLQQAHAQFLRLEVRRDAAFALLIEALVELRQGKDGPHILDQIMAECVALCEELGSFAAFRDILRFAAPEHRERLEQYLPDEARLTSLEVIEGKVFRGGVELRFDRVAKCAEVLRFFLDHPEGVTLNDLLKSCFSSSRSRRSAREYWYRVRDELINQLYVTFPALESDYIQMTWTSDQFLKNFKPSKKPIFQKALNDEQITPSVD